MKITKKSKILKRILSGVFTMLLCAQVGLAGAGCSTNEERKVSKKVDEITFSSFWLPDFTEKDFQLMKDCGIDSAMLLDYQCGEFGSNKWYEVIELCEKVGLKYSIHLPNAGSSSYEGGFTGLENGRFLDCKNIDTIIVYDEPSYNAISNIATWVSQYEPEYAHIPFITNLYPEYLDPTLLSGHSYNEYVQKYCKEVLNKLSGEKWLVTDIYPYYFNENSNVIMDREPTWLHNLEVLAKNITTVDNGHMAMFIQTCSFTIGNGKMCREVTVEDIRQQTAIGMAFGIEAFHCYTYAKPQGNYNHNEGKISMVYDDGTPTPIYYAVQQVISEIKAYQDIYLQYQFEAVKTFLAGEAYSSQHYNPAFARIENNAEKLNGIADVYCTEDTVMSSFYNKDGKYAYMVVNYADPYHKKQDKVTILFDDNLSAVNVIIKGQSKKYNITNGKLELTLDAGEGAFITL